MRKPKPRKTPSTLRELVLDLAERLEGGNATSDVWLPHEEWNRLAEAAELDDVAARLEAQEQAEPGEEEEVGREAVLSAALDGWRSKLAQALGAGVDTEFPDLLDIARGYAMALDAERQAVLDRSAKVVSEAKKQKKAAVGPIGVGHMGCPTCLSAPFVVRIGEEERPGHHANRDTAAEYSLKVGLTAFEIWEPRNNLRWDVYAKCESCGEVTDGHVTSTCPKAKTGEAPGRLRCPRCLGTCREHCVNAAAATRYAELSKLDSEHRHQLAVDHPAWFCARPGPEEGPAAGCVMQNNHAFDCKDFAALEAGEKPKEEPEAEHPECPHCGEADGHKPKDCAMNVDSDAALKEAAAAASKRPTKRRATKKFPLGGDPLELCTQCGASYGDHNGTRCPKQQRRMKFVDGDAPAAAGEGAPF